MRFSVIFYNARSVISHQSNHAAIIATVIVRAV